MAQSRGHSGCNKSQTSNYSSSPSHALLIDRFAVGKIGLDTCQADLRVGGRVDVNLNICIQIRNTVSDSWNLVDYALVKLQVGVDVELSSGHGAHSRHALDGTWIDCLFDEGVAICTDLNAE